MARTPTAGPPEPPDRPGDSDAKRALLEASLQKGRTLVYLDARRPGVRVPETLRGDGRLTLALSWRFRDADMLLNERGVAATLRFEGLPFRCELPWACVWGMLPAGAEQPVIWPGALPQELGGPKQAAEAAPAPVEPARPRLCVVPSDADAAEGDDPPAAPADDDDPDEPPAAPSRPGPRLRLVR